MPKPKNTDLIALEGEVSDVETIRLLYKRYWKMRQRCENPKSDPMKRYGRRGIFVCERWRSSFRSFFEDMGFPPTQKHSIERINNDGPYEPSNCRWATPKEQAENRRNTVLIEIGGEVRTMTEWCRIFGVPVERACQRIRRDGWPAKEAVMRPILEKWSRKDIHANQRLPELKTGPAIVV